MINLFPRGRVFVDEARESEADALVAIHADAFTHAWSADDFAALIAERTVFALGLRRETVFGTRHLAGFTLVRTVAGESEILTIAVKARSRGRGYGRLLMEETIRRLYRDGVAACFLEVNRSNQTAVGLYRSLGFHDVGERKGYYRDPKADGTALVMRLQLR